VAIDVRAAITCSLGTVISGNIGDDYIQGSGLIKTQGSVLVSGIITPEVGQVVTFGYTKSGTTRPIPRVLRVLSSFADPFRRTTQVELGCRLTYLSDLKDSINWTAFNDPENSGFTQEDSQVITLPIYASSVATKCLDELGLLATSMPLTNKFSIPEFDFGSGYVSILSDLLVSEGYFGHLNQNEVLEIKSLDPQSNDGPAFDADEIIEIGPIGVGQLPGEAVVVSYNTLKLASPNRDNIGGDPENEEETEERERVNWELVETFNSPESYFVTYTDLQAPGQPQSTAEYRGATSTKTKTKYQVLRLRRIDVLASQGIDARIVFLGNAIVPEEDPQGYLNENYPNAQPYDYVSQFPFTKWIFNGSSWDKKEETTFIDLYYEEKEVPEFRVTEEYGPIVSVASSIAADYLANGYDFNSSEILLSKSVETFEYDKAGNQVTSILKKYETSAAIASSASIRWATSEWLIPFSSGLVLTEETIQTNETYEGYTKDVVTTRLKYALTQNGQQEIAKAVENALTQQQMLSIKSSVLSNGLVHSNTQVTVSKKGLATSQERPPAAVRVNSKFASKTEDSDPDNGWRTDSTSSLELALGSASAQRRIELSLPFAPDDTFSGPSGGPFSATPSDAPQKANFFGRVQNRLLLGNRNGISIQLAPERLPAAPFAPIYIQAAGLTALYRVNATNWAFDSSGLLCSTDALFWGAIGGTGTFWFPVAPGVTALPAAPTVIDPSPTEVIGSVTTVGDDPQETLNEEFPEAVSGYGVKDTSTGNFWVYDGTTWNNVGTTPGPSLENITTIVLPYNETVAYEAPLSIGVAIAKFEYALELLTEVSELAILVDAVVAQVNIVEAPAISIVLDALAPQISFSARVNSPAANISLEVLAPTVNTGKTVNAPTAQIDITALAPDLVGRPGPRMFVPSASLELVALTPLVLTGATVSVPNVSLTVTAFKPVTIGKLDTEAFDLFLLIEDDLLSLRNP
jgi:hypothetical protein